MPAKKTDTPEIVTTADETAAQAQQDAMLDLLTEMQEKINRLEANQATPAATSKTEVLQQEFDSELDKLATEFADYPSISMITRRAIDGMRTGSDIRLKQDADATSEDACYWTLRWFNFGRENRAQEMAQRGWVKVKWDDLQNAESLSASVRQDEFVRRGDRGLEVLAKMPRKLYAHLKRRESAIASGMLSSESGLRNHLANTTASVVGKGGGNADQAGSLVNSPAFTVEISEGAKERFTA